jgi:hypothetical protein
MGDRMKTIDDFKIAIQKKLLDLESLEQNPWNQTKYALGEKCTLAEKDAGRLFYEAEEILDSDTLVQLKRYLDIDDHQWRLYKSKFINNPPEKD